jgi:hypothetical protein
VAMLLTDLLMLWKSQAFHEQLGKSLFLRFICAHLVMFVDVY